MEAELRSLARTPRIPKSGHRVPAKPEAQRKLWQDPEHRAKMIAARRRSIEDRRKNPDRYSRLGVPNEMHKDEAAKAWAVAQSLADAAIGGLEVQGVLEASPLPDTEEALAKAALHEVAMIALGPVNRRTKMSALKVLLSFTKARPAQRVAARITTPEEWLRAVIGAAEAEA